MRNGYRALVFLGAFALSACSSSESPFGPSMHVEARIVNELAAQNYHYYELTLTNHGTTPVFVDSCQGVERRVGMSWELVSHLSACATIQSPQRLEAGETLTRGATLPSVIVADEAPDGGVFRFVFYLTESEEFAAPTEAAVRTGGFEL